MAIAERAVPELVAARRVIDEFRDLIRKRQTGGLAAWLERALASPVASFAKGIEADYAAVTAAITSPWSNGQTEGTICRLKIPETTNVWPRQYRPAPHQIDADRSINCTKNAKEPLSNAD